MCAVLATFSGHDHVPRPPWTKAALDKPWCVAQLVWHDEVAIELKMSLRSQLLHSSRPSGGAFSSVKRGASLSIRQGDAVIATDW